MLRDHFIGLSSQAIPERLIRFDGPTGIKAFQKKLIQFLLRTLEARSRHDLHSGDGGVESLFCGRIRSGVNNGLDSLFLFRGKLHGQRAAGCDASPLHQG